MTDPFLVREGLVIPAHPLALDAGGRFDERRQRALTRYYAAAGVGGIAVGVHTTQFGIRDPAVGLLEPVLALAAETAESAGAERGRPLFRVAGVCGDTRQAVAEAALAARLGFHAVLPSLSALRDAPLGALVDHCREIAAVLPVFGFYLQPAVGGRPLPHAFWRRFAEIDNVVAIKIAPFDRYQTLDVVRAVCESGRADEIALYTGNDDNLVADLLTPFTFATDAGPVTTRIVGGLLGHWAVWTRHAVALHARIRATVTRSDPVPPDLLAENVRVTDANAALFDAAHGFAGCLPGIHEILRRHGLLESIRCLDPAAALSPGQAAELDRVTRAHPDLDDRTFVAAHLDEWLR